MANNLDAFVPELWSTKIIQKIDQTNVMLSMTNRDYEGEIRNAGDTVQVRTYGDVTMGSYARGQAITYNDLAPTKETLTIDETKFFAFTVDDLDKVQNDIVAMNGYADRARVSVNNVIESKLLRHYADAHASNLVTNGGSAITISASNAYTSIVDAGVKLDSLSVPQENRWVVVTPVYKGFLLKDTTYFIRATDLGDTIITTGGNRPANATPGFIGRVAGFDAYLSPQIVTDATGRYCMFGQGMPICYASQINSMEAIRRPDTFGTTVRGLVMHGSKVFTEDRKRLGYILAAASQ